MSEGRQTQRPTGLALQGLEMVSHGTGDKQKNRHAITEGLATCRLGCSHWLQDFLFSTPSFLHSTTNIRNMSEG